jgi:hypothetical protein
LEKSKGTKTPGFSPGFGYCTMFSAIQPLARLGVRNVQEDSLGISLSIIQRYVTLLLFAV